MESYAKSTYDALSENYKKFVDGDTGGGIWKGITDFFGGLLGGITEFFGNLF